MTDYPEIVSKSAFHFDTIITDEKTTIPFCVITTRMINGKNAVNLQFENIFIVHDLFDCFIEYIPLVKDVLENAVNKRVILFNYPGNFCSYVKANPTPSTTRRHPSTCPSSLSSLTSCFTD